MWSTRVLVHSDIHTCAQPHPYSHAHVHSYTHSYTLARACALTHLPCPAVAAMIDRMASSAQVGKNDDVAAHLGNFIRAANQQNETVSKWRGCFEKVFVL